jgi:DNA-binding winged helix-turn-helix (wHTH) protein
MGKGMKRPKNLRFAEFVFDFETMELERNGSAQKLECKPAQVLALLLASPGRLVPRTEMIATLWPGELHVDFDRRLDRVMSKLRHALGERALRPRFIMRLSRRGYRFQQKERLLRGRVLAGVRSIVLR